jgi:hypothetical protein
VVPEHKRPAALADSQPQTVLLALLAQNIAAEIHVMNLAAVVVVTSAAVEVEITVEVAAALALSILVLLQMDRHQQVP